MGPRPGHRHPRPSEAGPRRVPPRLSEVVPWQSTPALPATGTTTSRLAACATSPGRGSAGEWENDGVPSPVDVPAMRRAIALAERGLGGTSPNPVVGCVVLDAAGRSVGEGWHEVAGGPHAEVNALAVAGTRARGGTAVVTLEPCSHTGRTGPCTDALIAAGVSRVVFAVKDPTSEAGDGAAVLRAAGIEVVEGVLAGEAAAGNVAWLTATRLGRPHVTWKYAASLDGRAAAADGTSRWISGPASRADAHALRAIVDAVIVGSGTLRHDDPHLGVRHVASAHQPMRVVVASAGEVPETARVLDDSAPTLVAVAPDARPTVSEDHVVRVRRDPSGVGLHLPSLLDALWSRGVRSVLVEGGPRLAGSFLAAGLVDRVIAYIAPAVIGGDGLPALSGPGAATIGDARRFTIVDVRRTGPDLRVELRPVERPGGSPGPAAPSAEPTNPDSTGDDA